MPNQEIAPVESVAKNNWQFALLLALAAIILIQAPLCQSLWLDEAVSFWVAKDSLSDVLHRSFNYQGMSPLYFVILWCVRQVLGQSELALRMFSVAAMAAACGFLYALAKNLCGKQMATLSIAFFICQDITQKLAFSARPYAAAILCTLWSVYALLRWLQQDGRSFQIQYVLATLLTVYFHYLYAPLILIHVLIVALQKPADPAKLRRFFFILVPIIAVLLTPGLFQLSVLAQKSNSMKFMMERSFSDFALALVPMNVLAYLLIALAFGIVYDSYRWNPLKPAELRAAIILATWAVFPAAWLFVYSSFSEGSVFVDRFYAWAAPASAMLLALPVSRLAPQRALRNVFIVFTLMALFREVQHQWNVEDWKGAVQKANAAASAQVPILAYSGLIESEQIAWYTDSEKASFLVAPFSVYPITAETILVPGSFEKPEAAQYIQAVLQNDQRKILRFVLVCMHIKHEVQPNVWRPVDEYMTEYFEKQGFTAKVLEEKNPVRVIQFERSGI